MASDPRCGGSQVNEAILEINLRGTYSSNDLSLADDFIAVSFEALRNEPGFVREHLKKPLP